MMAERSHPGENARPCTGPGHPDTVSAVCSITKEDRPRNGVGGTCEVHHRPWWDIWPYPPPAYRVQDGDMRYPSWAGPIKGGQR